MTVLVGLDAACSLATQSSWRARDMGSVSRPCSTDSQRSSTASPTSTSPMQSRTAILGVLAGQREELPLHSNAVADEPSTSSIGWVRVAVEGDGMNGPDRVDRRQLAVRRCRLRSWPAPTTWCRASGSVATSAKLASPTMTWSRRYR